MTSTPSVPSAGASTEIASRRQECEPVGNNVNLWAIMEG
jgi:hypothetical protein